MSKRMGLISHQVDNGLLYVFVPGKHPDLVIDQRKISNDEQGFHVGDFISFIDINGSVTSPTRINQLFETRFLNNRLQVKVSVAFPPDEFSKGSSFTTSNTASTYKTLVWSPDFAFVGCSPDVAKRFCQNEMYKAWIERVPRMTESIDGVFVSWQIVDDVLDECDEQSKRLISRAPWNHEKNNQHFRGILCSQQMRQKPLRNRHPSAASLKKYIDNYEGLVTAVHDSNAIVWSLAIPDSEVVFLYGNRKGMKVGDWVQFNCAPSVRPYLNCYLYGKKFEIIEPILPAKAFNNTVQVEITMTIAVDNLKYHPTGEVTIETEILGAVEFGPRKFRQDYCNKCLSLITYKNTPSKRTGAVWQVLCVVNEGCVEFMQHSNSIVNFSNMNSNPSEGFLSTKEDQCESKVEIDDDDSFTGNKLRQPDLSSDLPGTSQKEVDDSFYSDFPCNDNTFGNGDVKNMKLEEEYDPLKKLAFGAVKPRVLQIDSSICYNGTDGPDTPGNPSTNLNEELRKDKQKVLDNRATEYWMRAWQIPEVRRQIAKADRVLYENVMQLIADLNARTDKDSLEEILKPLSIDKR